jgi:hypothetical protein
MGVVLSGHNACLYTARVRTRTGGWRTVKLLVDSGASRNMVAKDLSRDLKREEGNHAAVKFTFANGTYYVSRERCREVGVQLQGYAADIDFLVCELSGVDVVLGQEWLKAVNPRIDWAKETMTIGEEIVMGVGAHANANAEGAAAAAPGAEKDAKVTIECVTVTQMRRTLRKPHMVEEAAVFVARATEEVTQESARAASADAAGPTAREQRVQDLLNRFADRFEQPAGRAPSRPPDGDH